MPSSSNPVVANALRAVNSSAYDKWPGGLYTPRHEVGERVSLGGFAHYKVVRVVGGGKYEVELEDNQNNREMLKYRPDLPRRKIVEGREIQ